MCILNIHILYTCIYTPKKILAESSVKFDGKKNFTDLGAQVRYILSEFFKKRTQRAKARA